MANLDTQAQRIDFVFVLAKQMLAANGRSCELRLGRGQSSNVKWKKVDNGFGFGDEMSMSLTFGAPGIERDYAVGFTEYQTLKWAGEFKGECGLRQLVCHEVAHVLAAFHDRQYEFEHGLKPFSVKSHHGGHFPAIYQSLLKEWLYG